MKIEEAIRDLRARVDGEFYIKDVDNCEDMKLGIEALERLYKARHIPTPIDFSLLPGETDD